MTSYLKVEYETRLGTNFPLALKQLIREDIWAPKVIFDVGSGTGDFLAAYNGDGAEQVALDTSDVALRPDMKKRFFKHGFGYPEIALRNRADLVFSKSVIEHQRDPLFFMRNLSTMAVVGGYVVVMAPDWATTNLTFYDDPTHVSPATPAGLQMLAEMAGLKVIKITTVKQTARLLRNPYKAIAAVYGAVVPQNVALWLERKTGWAWFRWAKQKAILLIAMKVTPDAGL